MVQQLCWFAASIQFLASFLERGAFSLSSSSNVLITWSVACNRLGGPNQSGWGHVLVDGQRQNLEQHRGCRGHTSNPNANDVLHAGWSDEHHCHLPVPDRGNVLYSTLLCIASLHYRLLSHLTGSTSLRHSPMSPSKLNLLTALRTLLKCTLISPLVSNLLLATHELLSSDVPTELVSWYNRPTGGQAGGPVSWQNTLTSQSLYHETQPDPIQLYTEGLQQAQDGKGYYAMALVSSHPRNLTPALTCAF